MITEEQLDEWTEHGSKHTLVGAGVMLALIAEVRRLREERDVASSAAEAMKTLIRQRDYEGRQNGLGLERVRHLVGEYEDGNISIGKLVEDLRDGMHGELAQLATVTRERDAMREVVEAARQIGDGVTTHVWREALAELAAALAKLDEASKGEVKP
jgi:hypothetical protein